MPQTIRSRLGDLDLNVTDALTGRRYQVLPDGFSVVPSLRVTNTNLSQQDGSQIHPRFKTGVVVTMTVRFQKMYGGDDPANTEMQPACDEDLVEMNDILLRHLNAMRDLSFSDSQRYLWDPSGKATRMLTDVVVLGWPAPGWQEPFTEVTFSMESPFPYGVNETEVDTTVADGATEDFDNNGTADIWPVIQVNGPFTDFTITNLTTGLVFEYDSGRPGAQSIGSSHYAEIDFFKGTIFKDGDDADLIPGVVPQTTDFFTITAESPGPSQLTIDGADMLVKWAPGWS